MDPEDIEDMNPDGSSYRPWEEISVHELRDALSNLYFLDDPYLSMQAFNIAIVDQFIMELEDGCLQRLLEMERTPLPEAMFLNAQTQMWIFAVYELLRTWRQRANDFLKWHKSGSINGKIKELEAKQDYKDIGREMRALQFRRATQDPDAITKLETDLKRTYIIFKHLELLRITLAKHELSGGSKNAIPMAPGYARIDYNVGSLQYQL